MLNYSLFGITKTSLYYYYIITKSGQSLCSVNANGINGTCSSEERQGHDPQNMNNEYATSAAAKQNTIKCRLSSFFIN